MGEESKILHAAQTSPGHLLQNGLAAMQKYITRSGQAGLDSAGRGELAHLHQLVTSYLTTALAPSAGASLSLRAERELRTLAEALDLLLAGDLSRVGDILMQRFRAVEMAATDGRWDLAQHLELIPKAGVSSVPTGLRADLVRQQALHLKVQPDRRRDPSPWRKE